MPIAPFVTNFFARGTDGQKATEILDLGQCIFQHGNNLFSFDLSLAALKIFLEQLLIGELQILGALCN